MKWVRETGRPIPPPGRGTGGRKPPTKRTELHFALKALQPMENLLIFDGDRGVVNSCTNGLLEAHGQRYVQRKTSEGLRVWRVE